VKKAIVFVAMSHLNPSLMDEAGVSTNNIKLGSAWKW